MSGVFLYRIVFHRKNKMRADDSINETANETLNEKNSKNR